MKIRIIFVSLFCLLFLSCNNFQSNPSDYFDDFIKFNIKSKALDISNTEENKDKKEENSQLLSNLDYYFRIQNNQNKANKQEKIIAIEEKIDFELNDKIELYKVVDRLSKSVFLQADLDLISLSLFLDSSLIKQYENFSHATPFTRCRNIARPTPGQRLSHTRRQCVDAWIPACQS